MTQTLPDDIKQRVLDAHDADSIDELPEIVRLNLEYPLKVPRDRHSEDVL